MEATGFDINAHQDLLPPGKKILFAVLNWGIGHAVRSAPVIRQLLRYGYPVSIASDGMALHWLRQEFPGVENLELPAYDITYSRRAFTLPFHLARQMPHALKTIKKESAVIREYIAANPVDIIISDNRFGAFHPQCTNIYITHQLRVLSGVFTPVTTYLHARIYRKYDSIWVPDTADRKLTGELTKIAPAKNLRFIGWLSDKRILDTKKEYDITAILSGPEPQRSILEKQILSVFSQLSHKRTAIVRGIVENVKKQEKKDGVEIYNFLQPEELNRLINASETIISRPGYTSVMDMAVLDKKVIYIPTPGQTEQEYLASHLSQQYEISFISQNTNLQNHLLKILST